MQGEGAEVPQQEVAPPAAPPEEAAPVIPRSRLNEVSAQRDEARAALAEANAKLAEYEGLQGQLQSLTLERDTARESAELADIGYRSDEGRDMARFLYGRLAEADRPGSLVEWAKTAEHPALATYKPTAPEPAAPTTPPVAPAAPKVEPLTPNAGTTPDPAVPGMTYDEVREAKAIWERSKTPENLKRYKDAHARFKAGS